MRSLWLLVTLTALTLLSACSSGPKKPTDLTEAEYYREAREALDKGNFLIAKERLERLESRYPFGQYSEQAQLELIYVNFQSREMELALSEAERFIRLHPLNAKADYAYYMRGLTTYELAFNLVERRFTDDNDKRDTTPLRDAFQYFSELALRYPDSQYVPDARARMAFLRERLASNELEVARYYMKRHAFVAAINRATNVIQGFPGTHVVDDALTILIEANQELGLVEESSQALAILKLNYPDHAQLVDGEFVSSRLADTDRKSWLEIISFGLIR